MLASILVAALCFPAAAWDLDDPHVSLGPPPAWVEPSEPPLDTPAPRGMALEAAQYLLVDDQVRVSAHNVERYAHTSFRIVTREGLDSLSRMEVVFDPAWASVELHRLRVWRDGAWTDRLEGAHATVIREEASLWQHIFDGTRKLVVVMPDVRVGDVVDMSWSVDGLDPVFGGHYGEGWPMAWGVPAERRELRLIWPDGRPLQTLGFDVRPATSRSLGDGWSEARWELAHVLPVQEEYGLPVGLDPYPWVQSSDFAGWAEVVQWAQGVYRLPEQADPAVQALADSLWASSGTQDVFVAAAARWVQDEVRYFGMELGDASHVPHQPSLVLQRRYGDCKDKTLLLVSLLRARGVQAWPALVSRGQQGAIGTMLPSPTIFDHVIAMVRLGGQDVWIDATESSQGGAIADTWIPPFGKALLIAPGVGELSDVALPMLPQGRGTVEHSFDLLDDPERPAVRVETLFEGHRAEEMRRMLADISLARLQEDFLDHYASLGTPLIPDGSMTIRDEREANELHVVERYTMDQAWVPLESGAEELYLPPASIFDWLPASSGARRYPLALPQGLDEHEHISILADPAWELEDIEADVRCPWFELSAQSEAQEGSMRISYHLRVLRDRVEPHELRAYQAAYDEAMQARGYSLVRGEPSWQIPWDIIESILAFLVAVFAVSVAVPVSVFAAAVLVWLGMPRRAIKTG
jgi:hypothetical protein